VDTQSLTTKKEQSLTGIIWDLKITLEILTWIQQLLKIQAQMNIIQCFMHSAVHLLESSIKKIKKKSREAYGYSNTLKSKIFQTVFN